MSRARTATAPATAKQAARWLRGARQAAELQSDGPGQPLAWVTRSPCCSAYLRLPGVHVAHAIANERLFDVACGRWLGQEPLPSEVGRLPGCNRGWRLRVYWEQGKAMCHWI